MRDKGNNTATSQSRWSSSGGGGGVEGDDETRNSQPQPQQQRRRDVDHSPMLTPSRVLTSNRKSGGRDVGDVSDLRKRRVEDDETVALTKLQRRRRGSSLGNCEDLSRQYGSTAHEAPPLFESYTIPLRDDGDGPSSTQPNGDGRETRSKDEEDNVPTSVWTCLVYGLINATIVLPVIMSFGSIIYRDAFFKPYLPTLVKLTVVSGAVHQLSFCALSSLPFAVGSVQDAGLVFLAALSSAVVNDLGKRPDVDDARTLATATVGLSVYTALLGVGLLLIGRLRLASHVQRLPTSVVGGYLAYIGLFCGQAGLAQMADVKVTSVAQWYRFAEPRAFARLSPGLVGGVGTYLLVRNIRHVAVLPCCMLFMVTTFYSVLSFTGTSVQEARDAGWINNADTPPAWYSIWDSLRLDQVVWSALPPNTITVLSMIFVVALSSSLDVAAIELDLGRPLDYDREICTVGCSNLLSGLTGGYTGSYIFSQTIFSLRSGVRSRLCGLVLAVAELASVVAPVSILSYLPNFFFGGLLVMIAVDLLWEWLWDVRTKVSRAEYAVALATFALIQITRVEWGILAGVAIHAVCVRCGLPTRKDDDDDYDDDRTKSTAATDKDSPLPSSMRMSSEGGSLANLFEALGSLGSQLSLFDPRNDESSKESGHAGTNGRENRQEPSFFPTEDTLLV